MHEDKTTIDVIYPHRHLLGIEGLTPQEIGSILDLADTYVDQNRQINKKGSVLSGRTQINLFFEASTRTLSSFELAGKRLGADVMNMSVSSSSIKKGETLIDTAATLNAMHPDLIVVRHGDSGAVELLSQKVSCAVLNAGDGSHEHPTQALLDCVTLVERLGSLEGKTIAIVGDILHSRVARSNISAFAKLGARVRLVGPRTMLPETIGEAFGVETFHTLDEGIRGADVVSLLRIQLERQERPIFSSGSEYHRLFGLSSARLDSINPDAVVMHPGPVNPGVEMTTELMRSERTLIREQVANGVFARMATMLWLDGRDKA